MLLVDSQIELKYKNRGVLMAKISNALYTEGAQKSS